MRKVISLIVAFSFMMLLTAFEQPPVYKYIAIVPGPIETIVELILPPDVAVILSEEFIYTDNSVEITISYEMKDGTVVIEKSISRWITEEEALGYVTDNDVIDNSSGEPFDEYIN